MKSIVVVDDHDVVRQGVRLILRNRPDWEVVAEAEDGLDALEKISSFDPDLVILDITMPRKDGLAVAAELSKSKARSKILVLTMHDSRELARAVQKAGASGYVIKTQAARDLLRAVEAIFAGGTFFLWNRSSRPKKCRSNWSAIIATFAAEPKASGLDFPQTPTRAAAPLLPQLFPGDCSVPPACEHLTERDPRLPG